MCAQRAQNTRLSLQPPAPTRPPSRVLADDTNKIMKHFGVDDYVIAAIELYLDVINLFRYLLLFLVSSRS